jgi:hypothetical protein
VTVAVIGGGIQGCLAAIDVVSRGYDAVLFERRDGLTLAASRWNQGKIHLGYLFANDPSLSTARRMISGAVTFAPLLDRYLERPLAFLPRSSAVIYGVHRQSLITSEAALAHIMSVDMMVREAIELAGNDYLGDRRIQPVKQIPVPDAGLDEAFVLSAISTPERSIDSEVLSDAVAQRALETPGLTVLTRQAIVGAKRRADNTFELHDTLGEVHGPFEALVNATWDSRLAIDATLGYQPKSKWMNRYKVALHSYGLADARDVPTVTLMLGPLGDVVNFENGKLYVSWYPAGRTVSSTEMAPVVADPTVDDRLRPRIVWETLLRMGEAIPTLRGREWSVDTFALKGGYIFAWGESDIGDIGSELHQRHAIGVHSDRGYHSIDTGKLTMAPLNAATVGSRIAGNL